MNKKILLSLSVIAAVATIAVGGTIAYFSDTETSTNNTFSAGTIDIAVNGENPWTSNEEYEIKDMKPGQVDYSNFTIKNVGSNPVNVEKTVSLKQTGQENGINEPECLQYGGTWDGDSCEGTFTPVNNIEDVVNYDLSVKVYTSADESKVYWEQVLYKVDGPATDVTIEDINNKAVMLGMIPVGGHMNVIESYHMDEDAGNEYQSDAMTFDITLTGTQLKGTVTLEDKDPNGWRVKGETPQKGTFTYGVRDTKLNFTLNAISPVVSGPVALVAGYDAGTNPNVLLGTGTTDGSGNVTITGSKDGDFTNAKLWLIPAGDWDTVNSKVIGWHMSQYLWETGLFEFIDTDN